MKSTIIVYYSNTRNNKFIANKMSKELSCAIEPIKPRLNTFFMQMFFSTIKKSLGIRNLKNNLHDFDQVILVGPIWMGKLLAPLRSFIVRYKNEIKHFNFVTCCGTSDAVKDDQFGHAHVFKEVQELFSGQSINCYALPIGSVLPEEKQSDGSEIMKARLSDDNFTGTFKIRYDEMVKRFKVQLV